MSLYSDLTPTPISEPLPDPPQVAKLLDRLLEAAHLQHASLDRIFRDTDVLFNGNGLLNGLGVELVCETLKVPVSDQVCTSHVVECRALPSLAAVSGQG